MRKELLLIFSLFLLSCNPKIKDQKMFELISMEKRFFQYQNEIYIKHGFRSQVVSVMSDYKNQEKLKSFFSTILLHKNHYSGKEILVIEGNKEKIQEFQIDFNFNEVPTITNPLNMKKINLIYFKEIN